MFRRLGGPTWAEIVPQFGEISTHSADVGTNLNIAHRPESVHNLSLPGRIWQTSGQRRPTSGRFGRGLRRPQGDDNSSAASIARTAQVPWATPSLWLTAPEDSGLKTGTGAHHWTHQTRAAAVDHPFTLTLPPSPFDRDTPDQTHRLRRPKRLRRSMVCADPMGCAQESS